jgi:hypothetical protein
MDFHEMRAGRGMIVSCMAFSSDPEAISSRPPLNA